MRRVPTGWRGWISSAAASSSTSGRPATEPSGRAAASTPAPFEPAQVDPELAARWTAFADLPAGNARALRLGDVRQPRVRPARDRRAAHPSYLAQHDFVHVLADYGTNLKGELEVFGFIGRADPDPKGFAWLATLIGLFETGYISSAGFFDRDVRERNIRAPGMHQRVADAIRRGKVVCERYGVDLFDVDYYELADRPVGEIRELLGMPTEVVRCDRRRIGRASSTWKACPRPSGKCSHAERQGKRPREPQLQPDDHRALRRRRGADRRAARRVGSSTRRRRHHGLHGHSRAGRSRDPGQYVIIADFGVVDPNVSAADEAARNNERPETQAYAARLSELVGEVAFHHYDELYRTEFYGV